MWNRLLLGGLIAAMALQVAAQDALPAASAPIFSETVDVDVVNLEVFVQDTEAMISSYLEDVAYPMAYQALIDDGQVYEAYNVYLIPRLLLIDAGQVVRFDSAGRNVLGADILALVKDAKATPGAME